jgi:GT2 family glycosyltransferase
LAERPLVSVVIPTHQRRAQVRRALASLSAQTASPDSFEAIVSVDGSTDGTREMLADFRAPFELRVLDNPKRSRAAARNAALDVAGGEIVVVLDDDMVVVPEFVERHRRHHPPGSRLCVLGAVPVRVCESSPPTTRYVATKFEDHLASLSRPDHSFLPRDFYSGNASLRRETLVGVGGFDAAFTAYGNEDVELSLRLRQAGVEILYDPDALAHQTYDKNLRGLARDTFEKGGTTVMLARAHPDAFDALRLAEAAKASRAWRAARAVLLSATRRRRRVADAVAALGSSAERLGLWRRPFFYRTLLDYFFWAGTDAELRTSADEDGELILLAGELRRGPIDLLLHG